MRRTMLALVLLLTAAVSPASAQLQWRSTGVQQASHAEPVAPASRPAAKAPTVFANEPSAEQADVTPAVAMGPAVSQQGPRFDAAVAPACGEGGCVDGCGCGVPMAMEASCGISEPGCGLTYGEACGCGDIGCGGACGDACGATAVPLMIYVPPINELTLSVGAQAFKSALDQGRDRGNFGFNQAINLAGPMSWLALPRVGYQIGYRATQSQLHGDATTGDSTSLTQQFFTAGLFHRKQVGLQYGVVYDLLRDERQRAEDFGQIRGLISVTNPRGHEIGFQFAKHLSEYQVDANTSFHAVDQFLLFYRMHGCQGGEFRAFGGFDDDDKGILGGDFSVPLTNSWALETGFTYLVPEGTTGGDGATQEAWNIGVNLVWHYGKRARNAYTAPFRPMFGVADNGSLIVDDRSS